MSQHRSGSSLSSNYENQSISSSSASNYVNSSYSNQYYNVGHRSHPEPYYQNECVLKGDGIYEPFQNRNLNRSYTSSPSPSLAASEKSLRSSIPPPINLSNIKDSVSEIGDDLQPPASPVSSSYSELRRATIGEPQAMYNPYVAGSHTSSTYESIYEPINPRPSSQNSATHSGYSIYENRGKLDDDVNNLASLLSQNELSDNVDDIYEICKKCNQKIIGEDNGCTAMDSFYHTDCFTCFECDCNLQGKPFYNIDNKPYCEQDYLNTLEKCSVCQKSILDRILRATGKPYHPKCFTCVVCNKSLDGVPFTVDAANQIHCIEDFHKKFAPRCCVCKLPIMPDSDGDRETVRVVALDRSFHIDCYRCEDCDMLLSSEAEGRGCYPLDDHVLCKNCNVKRIQILTSHITTDL